MSRDGGLTLEFIDSLPRKLSGKLTVLLVFCFTALLFAPSTAARAGPVIARSGGLLDAADPPSAAKRADLNPKFRSVPSPSEVIEGATATDEFSNGAPGASELKTAEHSASLKQVLRSMTNPTAPGRHGPSPDASQAPSVEEPDAIEQALERAYRALIENETLGALLEKVVHVGVAEDGRRSFDVLGVGHFEVSVSPEDGNLYLTEGSLGLSVPLRVTDASPYRDDAFARPARPEVKRINLKELLWQVITLLDAGEWLLVSIIGGSILIPMGLLRLVIRASRRTPPPMRLIR
jgi:hypothetical protein